MLPAAGVKIVNSPMVKVEGVGMQAFLESVGEAVDRTDTARTRRVRMTIVLCVELMSVWSYKEQKRNWEVAQ